MKKIIIVILVILILFAGLSLMLYPTFSDYWNKMHQSSAIVDYAETVNAFEDDTYSKMWEDAVQYNAELFDATRGILPSPTLNYFDMLNVTDTGMMSYLNIPAIKVNLPLYHTVNEGVLQSNAGHVESSSLPVGGENTHCVISGHTGLPSARLFTDLETLQVDDIFILNTLGTVLTYQIDQIVVVNPWETDKLQIVPGQDYCTLVTCTPYGVNSHRLLVRGHRIETTQEIIESVKAAETPTIPVKEPFFIMVGIAALILLIAIIIVIILIIKHRKRKKTSAQK